MTAKKTRDPSRAGSSDKSVARPKVGQIAAAAGTSRFERASGTRASQLIDQRVRDLGDWRGETLARMRALILDADPEMTEEWKWMGTPVWSHHGNVCTGETYKQVVKLTFARGASLPDPARLFNSSLEGNTRRAIDIHDRELVNARAFKALVKAATALNGATAKQPVAKKSATAGPGAAAKAGTKAGAKAGTKAAVVLLAGGNPQIAKAEGDAPVRAYIAALPGWKRDLAERLDTLIVRHAPGLRKAVKWNSPFYGMEGRGWFLSFHAFTHYLKVTFFRATSLHPVPAGGTGKDARWIDIHEHDLDEAQLAAWVKQASALPGWDAGRSPSDAARA